VSGADTTQLENLKQEIQEKIDEVLGWKIARDRNRFVVLRNIGGKGIGSWVEVKRFDSEEEARSFVLKE